MKKVLAFFKNIGGKISAFFAPVSNKLKAFWCKSQPTRSKIVAFCSATGKWTYKLRGVVLAIPIAAVSVILAVSNMATLPATIAIGLPALVQGVLVFQEVMISKAIAVLLPLLVTAVCLLMMFLSRRASFPFLVSLFSLVLPLFFSVAAHLPG